MVLGHLRYHVFAFEQAVAAVDLVSENVFIMLLNENVSILAGDRVY